MGNACAVLILAIILSITRVRFSKAALLFGAFIDVLFLIQFISQLWGGQIDFAGCCLSLAAFIALLVAVADGILSYPRRRI